MKRKGWGSNLQNIEKSLRQIYIPDEGKIFVQVDQSGAEALIVAYCCRDGNYRQLFKNGISPHGYLGMHLFPYIWPEKMREVGAGQDFSIDELIATPIKKLNDNPQWKQLIKLIKSSDNWSLRERYYYLAKQTEHSSNYDIQPPTFRLNILEKSGGKIVISKEDSERFIATKHGLYPEIKEDCHTWIRRCVNETSTLYNLHGHPYQITAHEIRESDWKELYAWVFQSTVGEITNIAYNNLQDYIEKNNLAWDLLCNTHDSYMCQCPIDEKVECVRVMQMFLNQEMVSPFDGVKFSMKSEAVAGFNWGNYKKDSNPLGLREI